MNADLRWTVTWAGTLIHFGIHWQPEFFFMKKRSFKMIVQSSVFSENLMFPMFFNENVEAATFEI